MKASLLTLTASAAFMLASAASAEQPQSGNFLEQMLGGIFGNNNQQAEQTLENDWNQGQRPFAQRGQQLDARIDAAVRNGSISNNEADYMRREYDDIVRLEAQYGANGQISQQERSELRARYRALTQRMGGQNNGNNQNGYDQTANQYGGAWQPIARQNSLFEQQLSDAVRGRRVSQTEATRLRNDWRYLAQVEAQYQRGGIDAREQADLWSRYSAIDLRLGGGLMGSGFGEDRNTQRWRQMETRLAAAQRAGRVNATQAAQMRATMGDLERLDLAYARTGYGTEQRTYLTRRFGDLNAALGYNR